jgi:hypothetical protein
VRFFGVLLIVLGIALAVVSGFADMLGIGVDTSSPDVGVEGEPTSSAFGWKQALGLGLGVALIVAGAAMVVGRATRRT